MVTVDCSDDHRRGQLVGTPFLRGKESSFILGPVPTAFEIANETGFCILNFEEINALSQTMQKILNPVTDFRRRIEVAECKRVFELKKGAKLWVTASMNTSGYGGVYQLNEDLKSRLRIIPLTYPTEEKGIIDSIFSGRKAPDGNVVTKVMTLATETRQKSMEYALSPRDVIQILEDSMLVGIEDALWFASGKFEDADRKFFTDAVWRIFDNLLIPGAKPPVDSAQRSVPKV
jgi:MoxR-like ATPase